MYDTVVLDGSDLTTVQQDGSIQAIIEDEASVAVTVTDDGSLSLEIQADGDADLTIQEDGEFGTFTSIYSGDLPYYTGETTVTPTEETQVLYTADMALASNITINPIPSNYGKITWNGSYLTVS